jgi:DNA-binding transcriptional ArsR family regulator
MVLKVSLGVADLAATRFAVSPLGETIKALQLLARPDPPAVNRPWLDWAGEELRRRPLRLPNAWPLVVTGLPHYPEFLLPAPQGRWPAFADELAQLASTSRRAVRVSLRNVFGEGPWPDSARELFERPEFGQITAELTQAHDRLVAPHWERIRSVLDADIAYRTGLVASGGARAFFRDIQPDLQWSAGTLTVADRDTGTSEVWVELGPDGLVVMPGVFVWPHVSIGRATSTQTTLQYPARGAATVWHAIEDRAASGTAAEHLLGVIRARLLATLRSPATTTALARQLGVTPSAVSQHLAFLHRGGLIERQRSGRAVLYQISELGTALLGTPARAGPALGPPTGATVPCGRLARRRQARRPGP